MGSDSDHGETETTGANLNPTSRRLHIFFFPFMAPGHMIPMTDMAKLFAARGVKSTLLSTPSDEPSFLKSIERTQKLGFDIGLLTVKLPLQEVGLPENYQSLRLLPSPDVRRKFFMATTMLDKQFEKLIEEHRPDCVITDMFLPWTTDIVNKFGIPRIVFHGTCQFSLGAGECVRLYKPHANISSDNEPFLIPSFPGEITMTRAELPDFIREETEFTKFQNEVKESELRSYGVIVNSFYELEPAYADHSKDFLGRRSWRVGPLSMCNEATEDRSERWNSSITIDSDDCLKWLDPKEPGSVVYICFGSTTLFSASQLHEIAVGLEASGQQFVWVVKKIESADGEDEEWLPEGYEERMRERGLIIRGWAPQVMILNHPAVGGFVTHCGWNSTLEGISAGLPLVTWPVGAEQFYNQKLIVQVLRIGIPVGIKKWVRRVGDSVGSEKVADAVRRLMAGEEAEEMRVRAAELAVMARKAVEEGGSSHSDLTALLEELKSRRVVGR